SVDFSSFFWLCAWCVVCVFFFFTESATPEIYSLSLHDALPISPFERVLDLLGDGSIWAISTPGHSPNHVSYLVNAESGPVLITGDRKSTRLNSSHVKISYAVFCLKKKKKPKPTKT